MRRRSFIIGSCLVLLAACGDAPTKDTRGYSKAPLEKPGVFPKAEVRSDVAQFGEPIRPVPRVITLPDSASGG